MIGSEQKRFLVGRFREATKIQPDLRRLKTILLRLGGDFVVPPAKPDPDIPALWKYGFLMAAPIKLKVMESSSCHKNVAQVWRRRKRKLVGVATGYALSEDGLWRQHSWGILRESIFETTVSRLKYFGIVLQAAKADRFADLNSRER